jgi:hypothetical protein
MDFTPYINFIVEKIILYCKVELQKYLRKVNTLCKKYDVIYRGIDYHTFYRFNYIFLFN